MAIPGERMICDEWWFHVREWYVMNGDFRWEWCHQWWFQGREWMMWWMISGENGVMNGDVGWENDVMPGDFGWENNLTTGDFRWERCPQTAGTNQRSAGDPATLHLHRHEIPLCFSKPVSISVFWCVCSIHGANSVDTAAVFFIPVKAPFTADSFQEKYWLRGNCSSGFFHTFHQCVICEVNFCWDIMMVRAELLTFHQVGASMWFVWARQIVSCS